MIESGDRATRTQPQRERERKRKPYREIQIELKPYIHTHTCKERKKVNAIHTPAQRDRERDL